jgi:hypothetical protein
MMNLTEIKNSEEGVLGRGNLDSLFRNKFVVADVDGNIPKVCITNGYIEAWEDSNTPKPTQDTINTWVASLGANHLSNNDISIQRSYTYPSIGDQLDMIFHAGLGGDEFQAAIQAVKDAHPKPE